ncbi:hypothetical protein CTAYLR_007729 [Chrysophaeum taylorii]|uniref:Uncharacterized protein n=1 Tax=Chrysophaeum taylorii TaxID=2483200 RepID=A0AAD7ULJ3_9STRA|nr:hypothetical protein CTAYLR_007729 [Chrysophaeum taylorii]
MLELVSKVEMVSTGLFGRKDEGAVAATSEPLYVIGAGFARTGTSSLKLALETLGLRVYHMTENVKNHNLPLWHAWSAAKSPEERARAIDGIVDELASRGFNATTDFPASLAYEELLGHYPSAKVLLSVRSKGEVWAASVLSTIARFGPLSKYPPWRFFESLRMNVETHEYIWQTIGAPTVDGLPLRDDLAAAHDSWIDKVRATVPSDKLLVHEAKDGWKPLCEFLSPEFEQQCADILKSGVPYPHANDTSKMQTFIALSQIISFLFCSAPLLVIFLCARRFFVKFYRKPKRI